MANAISADHLEAIPIWFDTRLPRAIKKEINTLLLSPVRTLRRRRQDRAKRRSNELQDSVERYKNR
jgi:hypothetical protein